ncbi:MAG: amino acid permease [Elusimicrobia bacterium]|nr:amino acid permease [Elusimicrobiota bacterium]
MGGFANFAVAFTILSILTGAFTLYGHGLTYGGPAVNGIGWPLVTIFTLTVAASMAEIASTIPTAGAMYHWSALLGGPGWGWFTAWFNFVGQMAITAGIDYGIALFIMNLLGLQGQLMLLTVYGLLLLSHGLLNHYGIRAVAKLNDISVWYHIAVTAVIAVAFTLFAPRQPLSFAFKTGFTTTHYPYYWAFLVGLLQAQWTYTGYDCSAHITEETVDPKRNAPWGMIIAILVSGVCGYAVLLAVTLAIKDLPAAAAAENPFIYITEQALGQAFGKGLVWSILVAMWFCGLSAVTANARMIFAFARDKGLPGSKLLAQVSPKYRTPAPAVWLSVVLAFLVAVYSGAYNVIVSISTIGLYVSYIIPVILVLRARQRGEWKDLGPWNLGKWGKTINMIAVLWTLFISVLFVCPPNQLTGYTFAGLIILLAVYYFIGVRGKFQGPKKLGTEEELLRMEKELQKTSVYHEA